MIFRVLRPYKPDQISWKHVDQAWRPAVRAILYRSSIMYLSFTVLNSLSISSQLRKSTSGSILTIFSCAVAFLRWIERKWWRGIATWRNTTDRCDTSVINGSMACMISQSLNHLVEILIWSLKQKMFLWYLILQSAWSICTNEMGDSLLALLWYFEIMNFSSGRTTNRI